MEKIKSTLPNIIFSLTIICMVSGFTVSTANKLTASMIAASKATELQNAIQKVLPEYDNNPVDEQYTLTVKKGPFLTVYPAKKEDHLVGYAIESYSLNGYGGLIRILVGFDTEDKIINYSVLEHKETPGLGSKMDEWFRQTNKSRQNIIGRDMTQGWLKTTKDGGDIDAITAATISTRAFLNAISFAYSAYQGDVDMESGATTQTEKKGNKQK